MVTATPAVRAETILRPGRTRFRMAWAQFRRNRAGLIGLAILMAFLGAGLFAPVLAPYDPYEIDLEGGLKKPSRAHWLGQDELGRDLLSRIIYGARLSLVIGIIAVSIGVGFGVPIGAISGYVGGWWDLLVQRLIDIMLAFPGILLAIVLVAILGVGLVQVMVAVGIVSIPTYARLVRGQVLSLRAQEFVDAARALGATAGRILWRHVLPNTLAVIIVQSTLQIASAILSAAALGFLGLGAQPPTAEWGAMLSNARQYIRLAWHSVTFPGMAIMLTVLGFNLLGDAIRDALDPKMRI
ncbi:MAG: ABC transporter permease [Armatimonadota bacterium]|nr:ABC transporter permease [Armatimonadota bacterium]MDR7518396.1 ABC transporter permease [Armatimonadota bacterium]MDR7549304.1 ABC transporter permease [Armatimonadota bacterium]